MASETFKKRQKEMARKEKKEKKSARKLERKSEKARTGNEVDENKPGLTPTEESNSGLAQVMLQHRPSIL